MPELNEDGSQFRVMLMEAQALNFYWPNIDQALSAAPETWEGMTKEYIYEQLTNGTFQMWALTSPNAVHVLVMTSVDVRPDKMRVLHIHWMHGNNFNLFRANAGLWLDSAMDILNCENCVCEVLRRGMVRVLRSLGFSYHSTALKRVRRSVTKH